MFYRADPRISAEMQLLYEKIKERNILDTNLQKFGYVLIKQKYSGGCTAEIEESFKSYVFSIDQAHEDLINFVKNYLTVEEKRNILISGKYEQHRDILTNKIVMLKHDQEVQKEQYEDVIRRKAKEFRDQKYEADQKYFGLRKYCQEIEKKLYDNQLYSERMDTVSYGDVEINYKRKQQQVENDLKEHMDLIQHLNLQLSQCQAHNLKLTAEQATYDRIVKQLIDQINDQQQQRYHLDEKYQEKLKEFKYEISNLQITRKQREQQIEKVAQQNTILQKEKSKLETNFQGNFKLKEKYIDQGILIQKLQENLTFVANERDSLKNKLFRVQQETDQQNLIKNSKNKILQRSDQKETKVSQDSQVRTMENQNKGKQEEKHVSNSMQEIENILENVKSLETEVEEFSGSKED